MNAKLTRARRTVERLRLEADGAGETEIRIWDAANRVDDLEAAERESAVRTARTASRVMDTVLAVVAGLTMAFSLGNIHSFALAHGVDNPIAWFLAPAVDLALVAALMGDAVLSRWQLSAGPWATRLRWYAGTATLTLNAWEAVVSLDLAAIVLHVVPPVLLFVLAEAASPYRVQFAETVRLAGQVARTDTTVDTEDALSPSLSTWTSQVSEGVVFRSVPTGVQVDTEVDTEVTEGGKRDAPSPAMSPGTPQVSGPASLAQIQEVDTPVSTSTPQVREGVIFRSVPTGVQVDTAVDTVTPRLDADAAREAIETAWTEGLTVRDAASRATRHPSYVARVYAQLAQQRGLQPLPGQTALSLV